MHIGIMTGGWKIKVTTVGEDARPVIFRHYFVFDDKKDRAIALVKRIFIVNNREIVEAMEPVSYNKLIKEGMKPGQVKLNVL